MEGIKEGEKIYVVTKDDVGIVGRIDMVTKNILAIKDAKVLVPIDAVVTCYKEDGTLIINKEEVE